MALRLVIAGSGRVDRLGFLNIDVAYDWPLHDNLALDRVVVLFNYTLSMITAMAFRKSRGVIKLNVLGRSGFIKFPS